MRFVASSIVPERFDQGISSSRRFSCQKSRSLTNNACSGLRGWRDLDLLKSCRMLRWFTLGGAGSRKNAALVKLEVREGSAAGGVKRGFHLRAEELDSFC